MVKNPSSEQLELEKLIKEKDEQEALAKDSSEFPTPALFANQFWVLGQSNRIVFGDLVIDGGQTVWHTQVILSPNAMVSLAEMLEKLILIPRREKKGEESVH